MRRPAIFLFAPGELMADHDEIQRQQFELLQRMDEKLDKAAEERTIMRADQAAMNVRMLHVEKLAVRVEAIEEDQASQDKKIASVNGKIYPLWAAATAIAGGFMAYLNGIFGNGGHS